MDIASARAAMATNLATITGVQVNPYAMAQPTPPGLQILPPAVSYDTAMHRGLDTWTFVLQGFVALTSDIGSQVLLDGLCAPTGATSVKAALESDRTLGGSVSDLQVLEQSPGRVFTGANGGNPMLLVEWQVKVLAKGS